MWRKIFRVPPKNQEKRSFASKKLAGYMESTTKQRRKTVITTQMATIITALSKLECSFMKDEFGLDYSREKWTCYLSNYTIPKQRKLLLDDGKNVLSFCLENSFILERPRTSNLENVVLLPIKTVGLLVPNNMGIKMTQ